MPSLPASPRELWRDILRGYERVDLLTYANAIAFQVLFALIPLALFGLGMMGFLGLDGLYEREVQPQLRESASGDVFAIVDDTVRRVLGSGQLFWVTLGAVFTVWKMSGAMRAVMGVFERIYEGGRGRGTVRKYVASVLLGIAAGVTILAAAVALRVLPAVIAWPVTIVLLFLTVGLVVHYAPAERHPWALVSFGSVIVVVAWVGTSFAFGLYVTRIADYGTVFGNLATLIVVFEYLYLASVAFLTGALIDAILREGASASPDC